MREEMREAIELLNRTSARFNELTDVISDHYMEEEAGERPFLAYAIAAKLCVDASQLDGERKVYEGPCEVDNGRASVTIGGFVVRGDIQFEVLLDGVWKKGRRMNSRYGQCFVGKDAGTVILTKEHMGRVTLPLVMDR